MFNEISQEINLLVSEWESKLLKLSEAERNERQNQQNRTIKQIIGHMVDSASNNIHRIVQLQYREIPLRFHNYATFGNNDKWIVIQNYQDENYKNLIQLWKFLHLHFVHVIQNINPECLNHEWIAMVNEKITLKEMVEDFPRHFKLHLSEIENLLK